MQNTLREKIIEILKKDIKIIGWSDTKPELLEKLYSNIADQILSLIIEELPEEAEVPKGKHRGKSFCPQCEDTGYNAYREELIKMLNGV